MFGKIKKISFGILLGANIATILLMLIVGYAGRVSPVSYPRISTLSMAFPFFLIINFAFLILWIIIKFRYVIVPVLGFLICYGPVRTYMPINIKGSAPDGALKILSYNVWCFSRTSDLETSMKIPQYIVEEDADIVCLQEAEKWAAIKKGVDERLNPIYPYRDTMNSTNLGGVLAFYSKFPIIDKERIVYGATQKSAVAYRLDVNGDTLIVVNSHFEVTGLSSKDRKLLKNIVDGEMKREEASAESMHVYDKLAQAAQKRAPQAKELSKYVAQYKDKSIIVCGDFNDTPLSFAHRQMTKNLKDCFVESGNGFGFSYNRGGLYVRIDNILCSENIEPFECKVDKKIDISDHYPIKCKVKIR